MANYLFAHKIFIAVKLKNKIEIWSFIGIPDIIIYNDLLYNVFVLIS